MAAEFVEIPIACAGECAHPECRVLRVTASVRCRGCGLPLGFARAVGVIAGEPFHFECVPTVIRMKIVSPPSSRPH
jgi:hypothetical protein